MWIKSTGSGGVVLTGRGADGSMPDLGSGGFRFDSEVPDWFLLWRCGRTHKGESYRDADNLLAFCNVLVKREDRSVATIGRPM